MKRAASLLGMFALVVCMPAIVTAGDYHTGTTLICTDCHVMHYSQTEGYNPDGSGSFTPLAGGPWAKLLRNDTNDLCLSCHDGQSTAPDVLTTNANAYVRQAGALNRPPDGQEHTGHSLESTEIAPGSNPSWSESAGLNCANCHEPHGLNAGGNAYRNLRDDPGNYAAGTAFVSYATATNSLTEDVYQVASTPLATHYAFSNIFFNEPDPTKSEYATFCKGCHTDFHGDKGGGELGGGTGVDWIRHPTNNADIGAAGGNHSSLATFTGHTNRVQTMSATGVWSPPASDNSPSCMSCHKGHGNQNAFGLIYMSGTGTIDEEGDSGTGARDLCKQCHVQG